MIGAEPHLLLASPGTRVLLVGSGTYAADSLLPEVDAVPGTVADLGRCLVERAGLHPANLTTLIDPPSPLELGAALVETAEQATDVLMVYYVGHGLIGADNELYLATRATVDLTKGIAEHQALPYATLRQALAHCTASIIVVVLDCCFAGRAKTLSRDAWRRLLDATPQGTYLLAAAERDQSAFAPQGNRHTAFTGALIDLLDNGDPTAPALLDLDDIYRCLSRALPEQGYPAPRRRATDHGDRRPVAPNPARLARRKPQEGAQDDAGRTAGPGGDGEGEFSPYRGLAAFTAGDADYFFGREELTRTLVDRVAEQATTGDPLVVIGPSGSGKSSLLRAGLIATLRRSSGTEVILLTPGPDPLGALAARLAHLDGSHTGDLRARLEKDPAVLRQVVADALDGRQAVIIVDQFEELFTVCGDERQRQIFIQALQVLSRRPAGDRGNATVTPPTGSDGAAVTTGARPAAVVVLGVRSDFFGHCARYRELVPVLEHPVVVGPMSPAQLRQAIEGPAHRAGLSLEPGLVDLILQDLGTEPVEAGGADRGVAEVGVLPLLSHALLVTWQHREGRMLTMAGYRATGGIHRALARTADATLEQLDLGARAIARQMLTRLVRLGDGRDDTRRVMPLDELLPARESAQYGKARQVLDRFVKARLLTVDANAVQLAHEALIRAWPRLRLWIDTDRSTLLVHQALSQDADEWHRNNRDPAYLYQGVRLAGAQQAVARWQSDPGRYPVLMGIAREFLHAGEAAANRQARRRSLTVLALAISLVLALTGTGIATKFALDAGEESARSLSRQLAAQSESIADTDIRLARQLATTAWDIAQTEDARLSLIKSLLSPDRVTLTGHTQPLSTAVFSPDRKLLATASNDNTARLWDTTTGKTIATLTGHTNHVTDIAFSPDGKLLATASHDNTARLWDTTGKHITALTGHTNSVTTVAFSPDGKLLATASDDDTARLWDITTGEVTILTGHNHSVTAIAFSPDGKLLATTSYDNTARLWDTISGEPIATLTGHTGSVTAVAFRPDGKLLATASHDNTARLWNTTGKHITTLTGHTDNVTDIAFSPDGELLATTSYDNTARLWDTTSGEPIATLTGHTGSVTAVAFRPDGKLLATASDDNTARLWDTTTGEVTLLTGHMSSVTAIAFSPDGKLLATASDDNTARLWDTTTGKTITTLTGHTDSVTDIAFSPDGKLLATASHDNTARLWDTTGKHIATLTGHTDSVTDIAFSPDGKLLATASHDNTARLWETTGKHIATLTGHEQWVTAITFSPDGKLLATASDDNTARLWDTTGKHITTLTGHKHWVTAITFSPDGKLLATASADATARVWDTTTGKTITTLTGHKHYVTAITFSPDGKLLATVSHDNTARLWDTTTGKTITTLTGHKHHVTAITFSPDGKLLATASADGTGRIWNVEIPSDPFLAVCSLTGGQMGKEDWEQYLPGEPYREVCP